MLIRVLRTAYTALLHRFIHKQARRRERWQDDFSPANSRLDEAVPRQACCTYSYPRAKHCHADFCTAFPQLANRLLQHLSTGLSTAARRGNKRKFSPSDWTICWRLTRRSGSAIRTCSTVTSCCDSAMASPPGGSRRRGSSSSTQAVAGAAMAAAAGSPRRRASALRVAASSSRSALLGR